ncbi:MAG: glycosyltransferase family 39 protein [Pirellulaceae bacterium]|nr:glycosyltransferase family 39 protein [Pirellulaceae bacterium]
MRNTQAAAPHSLPTTPASEPGNWYDPFVCAAAALIALVPFLTKAVHLDDTVFIYVAKQISQHPADPFGLVINWYGHQMPLHEVQQNGPLASYYMALAAAIVGWSEVALHSAFLLPAMAAAVGMYYLARRFCSQPLLATLIMVFSPVFVVSGTTLMCDVIMLSLWIWAVVLWIWGADRHSHGWAILSAVLIGAGIVTKYYAAAVVPLLLAYSVLRWSDVRWRVAYLLIPIAIVLAYDAYMSSLYGHSLLRGAGDHALLAGGVQNSVPYRIAVGLTFTGGCLAAILFYAPLLCSWRSFAIVCGLCLLVALLLPIALDLNTTYWASLTSAQSLLFIVQFALFLIGGAGALVLAGRDVLSRRDADAWLLGLWVAGTFVFCSLLNWTVNGRSLLPMAPPISLLIVRALPALPGAIARIHSPTRFVPLVFAAVLAMCVAWADTWWANSARSAAQAMETDQRFGQRKQHLYYTGHWGFQYYMDALGFKSLNRLDSTLQLDDALVLPENNTNVPRQLLVDAAQVEELFVSVHPLVSSMRPGFGAGFYTSQAGPLPFSIGWFPAERYWIMTVTTDDVIRMKLEERKRTSEQQPDSAEARHQLAVAMVEVGRIPEAIEAFEVAVQLEANNVVVLNDFAWVLATRPTGDAWHSQRALMLAQQAHELTGGRFAEYLDTLAVALAANQRYDEAVATAKKALELLKDDPRKELIQQIDARRRLYQQRRPYREAYPEPDTSPSLSGDL